MFWPPVPLRESPTRDHRGWPMDQRTNGRNDDGDAFAEAAAVVEAAAMVRIEVVSKLSSSVA